MVKLIILLNYGKVQLYILPLQKQMYPGREAQVLGRHSDETKQSHGLLSPSAVAF